MNTSTHNDHGFLESIYHFEKMASLVFPKELLFFLSKNNGLVFNFPDFTRIVDDSFSQGNSLEAIFKFEKMIEVYFDLQDDDTFVDTVPNAKLIPIASTLGSPIVCMASSPDPALHGKIYVWDWDFRATYQADSLEEFLGQLHEYQEI
jgi:SMI1-KNR4 cell-wall